MTGFARARVNVQKSERTEDFLTCLSRAEMMLAVVLSPVLSLSQSVSPVWLRLLRSTQVWFKLTLRRMWYTGEQQQKNVPALKLK